MADEYDPADHTVADVLDYVDGVDPAEVQRVYDMEAAGKARSTLLEALEALLTEPEPEAESVEETEAEPAEAVDSPPKAEPAPESQVHAGGHVLTEDVGWVVEEEG